MTDSVLPTDTVRINHSGDPRNIAVSLLGNAIDLTALPLGSVTSPIIRFAAKNAGLFGLATPQTGVGFEVNNQEGFRVAKAYPSITNGGITDLAVDFGDPKHWDRLCPQGAIESSGDYFRYLPLFRWDHVHQKFNVTSTFMIERADTPELGFMRYEGTEDAPAKMVFNNDANDFIGNIYGWPMGEDAANGGDAFATGTSFVAGLGRVGEYYTRIVENPDRNHRGGAHDWAVTPKGAIALPAHPTFAVHRMALLHNGGLFLFGNAFWENQVDDVTTRLTASLHASAQDAKGVLHLMMPKDDAGLENIFFFDKYNHQGDGLSGYFDYDAGTKGIFYLAKADDYARIPFFSVDIQSGGVIGLGEGLKTTIGNGYVRHTPVAVSALPSAATAGAGARAFVSDANASTFASTVAGGGSTNVPVYSDGTNWKIG